MTNELCYSDITYLAGNQGTATMAVNSHKSKVLSNHLLITKSYYLIKALYYRSPSI